jgi:hypothetical protein
MALSPACSVHLSLLLLTCACIALPALPLLLPPPLLCAVAHPAAAAGTTTAALRNC